jgi:hypothetical protein
MGDSDKGIETIYYANTVSGIQQGRASAARPACANTAANSPSAHHAWLTLKSEPLLAPWKQAPSSHRPTAAGRTRPAAPPVPQRQQQQKLSSP